MNRSKVFKEKLKKWKEGYRNRVEQIIIRRSNPDYKTYSKMGHKANNGYNLGTYIARQCFFGNIWVSYTKLNKKFKHMNAIGENCLYSQLTVQIFQQILKNISKNFNDFHKSLKEYKKHPKKFTGRPKLPHYHHKGKPCTFCIDNQDFIFDKVNQCIKFCKRQRKGVRWWKRMLYPIHMTVDGHVDNVGQIIVVPNKYYIKLLISYQVKLPKIRKDNGRYLTIDPGVNNLLCCGSNVKHLRPFIINGRGVKSINQFANKQIAQTKTCLMKCNHQYTSHHLDFLFAKRHFKLYYLCHEASKDVVDYALNHDLSRIVIGNGVLRSKQHSKMGKRNNQNFIQIPFRQLFQDIKYKARNAGIQVIITEESYTSQSSFLDNEKPCAFNGNKARKKRGIKNYKRRVQRGLYKNNHGTLLNADLDGALQILKKVRPHAYDSKHLIDYVASPRKVQL